jgi:hypothetical membrane protein
MENRTNPPLKTWENFKYGGLFGVLGPVIICLGMLIAALGYVGVQGQSYNLLNHFVSELGEIGTSDLALAFNLSLVLGGLFNGCFMTWLPFQFQGWLRYPLLLIGFSAAFFGSLVGIFPMNALDQHIFVALLFFDLGLLTALAYSIVILASKKHSLPKWLAIPGIVNTATFFVFTNFPSQWEEGVDFQDGMGGLLANRPDFIPLALMEWVVILGVIAWFLMMGIYFLARNNPFVVLKSGDSQE